MSESGSYFLTEGPAPTAAGRFINVDDVPEVTFLEGLTFKPVLGEDLLVNHVYFAPHVEAPTHVHVEEQVVVVLEGELEFWVGEETRVLRRGDVAVIPPWVAHGGRTHDQGCLELDVFTPPRAQLLALLQPAPPAAG